MRIPRIYTATDLRQGTSIRLDKTTANYLLRVLRLKPAAEIILFNGQGGHYVSVIKDIQRGSVEIDVGQHVLHEVESPLDITLAQGISRGERMDYTIQKSVELGVNTIIPLLTERCSLKLDSERAAKRLHHWQGIIASACEQSGRNRLTTISSIDPLHTWLAQFAQFDNEHETASLSRENQYLKLVLDPHSTNTLSHYAKPNGAAVILLIGPEGGLTLTEIQQANQAGFAGIRLGPRILRTETAGIAAICALQSLWGDLGG